MQVSNKIMDFILLFLPTLGVLVASGLIIWGCYRFFIGRHPEYGSERKFPFQILILALSIVSILAVVIVLPINEEMRNQVMGIIGILLSGIIAFSSTNIIANLMGGVLLRITKPFATGDFIRVDNFFGRVSQRGLFDTEIQSEDRELITLPNAYLVKNPISAVISSGAIVSVKLSLGYDVHHLKIEPLLIKAAEENGLEHPFVHILELGDFSVTYRISGLLTEAKGLITTRSNLSRSILDTLHGQGIEIVSPTFMNQRKISEDKKFIPVYVKEKTQKKKIEAEDIVFDKAEQAEKAEEARQKITDEIKNLEIKLKDADNGEKDKIKKDIEARKEHLKKMQEAEISVESKK